MDDNFWKGRTISMAELQNTSSTMDDQATLPFLGRWQRLISSTNWEKGRIISEWRAALLASDADPTLYSDEAWSQRVGGVTGQHVGRLRRVFDRFGAVSASYDGLYWSHFQAALDWDDAEMWLEGAVQNKWSVSDMRTARWTALGGLPEERPREADVISTEVDEDFHADQRNVEIRDPSSSAAQGPDHSEGPDFGEESSEYAASVPFDAEAPYDAQGEAAIRPFEHLPDLPVDLAEAFESMKLAIIRHKLSRWSEVSRDDVLRSLDALKTLAAADSN